VFRAMVFITFVGPGKLAARAVRRCVRLSAVLLQVKRDEFREFHLPMCDQRNRNRVCGSAELDPPWKRNEARFLVSIVEGRASNMVAIGHFQ